MKFVPGWLFQAQENDYTLYPQQVTKYRLCFHRSKFKVLFSCTPLIPFKIKLRSLRISVFSTYRTFAFSNFSPVFSFCSFLFTFIHFSNILKSSYFQCIYIKTATICHSCCIVAPFFYHFPLKLNL